MNGMLYFVVILICSIGIGTLLFIKRGERAARSSKGAVTLSASQQTANEFINVKDIRDKFLYTQDGFVVMYIKINSISIDLLSEREKVQLCKTLTAELSSEQNPFKFLAVSRPVDISPLINEYAALISETNDQRQKDLLRNEMLVMSNYALSGDVVERQFYIMIWENYEENIEQDLAKRCYEFSSKFENSNIRTSILKEQEIVRLCNLINNPAYTNIEDADITSASIPILM